MSDYEDKPQAAPYRRAMSELDEGIALAQSGDRQGARRVLRRIVQSTPEDEKAWLWLAWVADTPDQSLQTLHEAQAFVPDSSGIEDALSWAKHEIEAARSSEEPAPSDSPETRPRRASATAGALASRVGGIARAMGRGGQRTLGSVSSALRNTNLPKPSLPKLGRLRGLVGPLLSGVAVLALFLFALLGIANARRETPQLPDIALPTMVPEVLPTASAQQIAEPLLVQAEVAFTREDWDSAIESLGEARLLLPDDVEVRRKLSEACYRRALELIEDNKLEAARVELDRAIRVFSASDELQDLRYVLKLYMDGVEAYWAHEWLRAAERLTDVYDIMPTFRDTHDLLGEAYYRQGKWYADEERWEEAKNSLESCLELLADHESAKQELARVMDVLIPPRRIEVDLSDKRVTVFENHQPKYRFPVCTGRPSAPTVPGRYEILDKMPMAYASKWSLEMPWWMGIYWAGGSENGFHALPILSNGTILWRGALGTGCSFGCIVLDTDDAITLYNWAELGTAVLVNW